MCDTCMAGCCTLIVEVRAPDLIRLGLTDEWEVAHCLNDLVKRLKKQHVIQRYCPKTGVFVLGRKRGSDCIFLDRNRRCTVYERRPAVCRSHPETVGPRIGHCPYMPI
ncbi:YkgJ family cysteine cluster protein [Desulfatiferula olefinivorans]